MYFWGSCFKKKSLALLLVDPPVGDHVYVDDRKRGLEYGKKEVSKKEVGKKEYMKSDQVSDKYQYQGGYRDFSPWSGENQGPSSESHKVSMFNNIVHYWRPSPPSNHPKKELPKNCPLQSADYAKKIIAGMWIVALEYLQNSVGAQECLLEDSAADMRLMTISDVALVCLTSCAYQLKRRCLQFSDDMDHNLMELDISLTSRDKGQQDWIYSISEISWVCGLTGAK